MILPLCDTYVYFGGGRFALVRGFAVRTCANLQRFGVHASRYRSRTRMGAGGSSRSHGLISLPSLPGPGSRANEAPRLPPEPWLLLPYQGGERGGMLGLDSASGGLPSVPWTRKKKRRGNDTK